MKKTMFIVPALALALAGTLHAQTTLSVDKVPRMSIEQLKQRMGDPNLVIIDVRSPHDWEESTTKIKGAVREEFSKIGTWVTKYPPRKTIVFYCA